MKHISIWMAATLLAIAPGTTLADEPQLPVPLSGRAVPAAFHYQGRVSLSGVAYNGPGEFKFALVSPTVDADQWITRWSNDGTSRLGEAPTAGVTVEVRQGLYSVMLGNTALPGMTVPLTAESVGHAGIQLRVWFKAAGAEYQRLEPDQRIASVAFALVAAEAQAVAPGAVGTVALREGAVTGSKLAPAAVGTAHLTEGSITSAKIAPGAIGTAQLANGSVTAAKLEAGSLGAAQLTDGSITGAKIAPGSIGTAQLADGSVTAAKLEAGSLGTSQLIDGSITGAKIAPGAIGTAQLADGAVTSFHFAPAAVDARAVADGAIDSSKLAPLGIGEGQLADGAVSTGKLADESVVPTKIASDAAGLARVSGGAMAVVGSNVGIGTGTPQAALDVNGEVRATEGVRLGVEGERYAVAGEGGLRLVAGVVSANGTVVSGRGFTVKHTAPGLYEISMDERFAARPVFVATANSIVLPVVTVVAFIADVAYVRTMTPGNPLPVSRDNEFSFTAIGLP